MKNSNSNSIKNQEIKRRFVEREVLACFSYEMKAMLGAESKRDAEYPLPMYDDVENLYHSICPLCGDAIENINHAVARAPENYRYGCPSCTAGFDELDSAPQDIYEWWIVSRWFCEKLRAKGEPVLEWGNTCYWGRITTGQAILLDGVISEICSEMEILEGQKYSWEEK